MLIWLNGAHGAGKTSVARRILRLRPGARLLDPEQIGFRLRRASPVEMPDDFKDLPAWRAMTLAALRTAAAESGQLTIVPMTLTSPDHFEEIVGGLRADRVALRHFTLAARPETLRGRLRRRLDWPSSRRWAMARTDRDAAALADPLFAVHLDAEARTVRDLAELVLEKAGA